jgi:iron complex outermembrane receptor protein
LPSRTTTGGVSLQAVRDGKLFDHANLFTAGLAIDISAIHFSANSTLGLIFPDLGVQTAGGAPGEGQIIRTAGAIAYDPVVIHSATEARGLYATDTFDLTDRLFLTVSGRFNAMRISTSDRTGTSPDLSGKHQFDRFNPSAGLAWKVTDAVTLYGGYAETNRAPTTLELSCSDPLRPCLLENALVADPPLNQVISHTWQAGLRGSVAMEGRLSWGLSLYRSDNDDDIVALSSAIQGRGSYGNVPRTRRQGGELEVAYRADRWRAYASASEVEATYRFSADLPSRNSPFADDNGNLHVTPGDRIGGIAPQRYKLGGDFDILSGLTVGGDLLGVSAQRRVGDETGQDVQIPSYWVAGAHASWTVGHGLELFGRIDNLFDRKYASYGAYFGTDGTVNIHPDPLPTDPDPRTDTPAPPRSFRIGLRARW